MGFRFWFWVCSKLGHKPAEFKHPQQEGVECRRCECIVDRDGRLLAGPLWLQRYNARRP